MTQDDDKDQRGVACYTAGGRDRHTDAHPHIRSFVWHGRDGGGHVHVLQQSVMKAEATGMVRGQQKKEVVSASAVSLALF